LYIPWISEGATVPHRKTNKAQDSAEPLAVLNALSPAQREEGERNTSPGHHHNLLLM